MQRERHSADFRYLKRPGRMSAAKRQKTGASAAAHWQATPTAPAPAGSVLAPVRDPHVEALRDKRHPTWLLSYVTPSVYICCVNVVQQPCLKQILCEALLAMLTQVWADAGPHQDDAASD